MFSMGEEALVAHLGHLAFEHRWPREGVAQLRQGSLLRLNVALANNALGLTRALLPGTNVALLLNTSWSAIDIRGLRCSS